MRPTATWSVVSAEPDTSNHVLLSYGLPLVVIPAVCSAIGLLVFGYNLPFFGHVALSPVFVVASLVVGIVRALVGIFLTALIIDAFAPSFATLKNSLQSMKVAVYAYTPVAAAGILGLVAPLATALQVVVGLVVLAGVGYAIYLVNLGLVLVMGTPREKSVAYTAAAVITSFIAALIVGYIMNILIQPLGPDVHRLMVPPAR